MIPPGEQYPFVEREPTQGTISLMPCLPLSLSLGQQTITALGLLDTGAMVNVLPYSLGVQLGADWNQQTTPVRLTGNLASVAARGLAFNARHSLE